MIHGGFRKEILLFAVNRSGVYIPHSHFFNTNELVAGKDVSRRGNRNILIAATTTSEPANCARSLVKIQHKMKKVDTLSPLLAFKNFECECFIFFIYSRQILLTNRIRQAFVNDNRFNGNLIEANIRKMLVRCLNFKVG